VCDVRVVQGGKDLGFTFESGQTAGVGRDLSRQDLDRHVAVQFGIACAIHLAHSAAANQRQDFVGAEPCSAAQWHALFRR